MAIKQLKHFASFALMPIVAIVEKFIVGCDGVYLSDLFIFIAVAITMAKATG